MGRRFRARRRQGGTADTPRPIAPQSTRWADPGDMAPRRGTRKRPRRRRREPRRCTPRQLTPTPEVGRLAQQTAPAGAGRTPVLASRAPQDTLGPVRGSMRRQPRRRSFSSRRRLTRVVDGLFHRHRLAPAEAVEAAVDPQLVQSFLDTVLRQAAMQRREIYVVHLVVLVVAQDDVDQASSGHGDSYPQGSKSATISVTKRWVHCSGNPPLADPAISGG